MIQSDINCVYNNNWSLKSKGDDLFGYLVKENLDMYYKYIDKQGVTWSCGREGENHCGNLALMLHFTSKSILSVQCQSSKFILKLKICKFLDLVSGIEQEYFIERLIEVANIFRDKNKALILVILTFSMLIGIFCMMTVKTVNQVLLNNFFQLCYRNHKILLIFSID